MAPAATPLGGATALLAISLVFLATLLSHPAEAQQPRDQATLTAVALANPTFNLSWVQPNFCTWTGVTCNNQSQVTRLDLHNSSVHLKYTIPPQLSALSSLQYLDLSYNLLEGTIPKELSLLSSLTSLNLTWNSLVGPIPPELSLLSNLIEMRLMNNQLNGTIPPELSRLPVMNVIALSTNQLTGSFPSEWGAFKSLTGLYCSFNLLSGPITKELGNISTLKNLYIYANKFTGPIPAELSSLSNLEGLILNLNQLSGPIPPELSKLSNLKQMSLQDNLLSGPIPKELSALTSLNRLHLSHNQLTGPIPAEFSRLINLTGLYIMNNQINGSIPKELSSLTKLKFLYLQNNNLTGPIPPEFSALTDLTILNLHNNQLSGSIPGELSQNTNLSQLFLSSNRLTGPIPPTLSTLRKLRLIDLSDNYLRGGGLPQFAGGAVNASYGFNCYNLSDHQYYEYGQKEAEACATYYQDLSNCKCREPEVLGINGSCYCVRPLLFLTKFTCNDSQSLGNFSASLEGTLQQVAGELNVLKHQAATVNFSMENRRTVSMSMNILPPGGMVENPPEVLEAIKAKLAAHKSTGSDTNAPLPLFEDSVQVPFFDPGIASMQLINLDYSVLTSDKRGSRVKTFAGVGAAVCVLAVLISVSCVLLLKRGRKDQRGGSESFDGLKVYSYNVLKSASTDFSHVLGGGGSAQVFRAELDGQMVAVKKLKDIDERRSSLQEFSSEAKGLGQLLHVNVVRLLGYSSDSNRPKMLVYEFLHGGSLESLLYAKKGEVKQNPMSFERRMAIALGIARGIEYCHHSVQVPLIHRDLKPANILMTSDDDTGIPKVADFGLARILEPTNSLKSIATPDVALPPGPVAELSVRTYSASSSTATGTATGSSHFPFPPGSYVGQTTALLTGAEFTSVAGTHGYIDPEYYRTSRPTLKSDVYSYGALLLELIMGKQPLHILAHLMGDNVDRENIQKGTGDTFSSEPERPVAYTFEYWLNELLGQGEEAVVAKVQSLLGQDNLEPHACYEALKVAYLCLMEKAKMRPTMRQVVRMMEAVSS